MNLFNRVVDCNSGCLGVGCRTLLALNSSFFHANSAESHLHFRFKVETDNFLNTKMTRSLSVFL